MGGRLDPAVAASRLAVREALADVEAGQRVLVACSGGPDSMALAAAAAREGHAAAWSVSVLIVDHGLHPDSAEVATSVAARLTSSDLFATLESVDVVQVDVGHDGGPEAAARSARYAALAVHAERLDAVVLLGHTRDDQAESVLLGLARGSGLRSLAAMRAVSGRYRRPFLALTRAQTTQVCQVLGLEVWHDPANADERFGRVRVRRVVLPVLEAELGPGVAAALARTAEQAAADVDALDTLADALFARATAPRPSLLQVEDVGSVDVESSVDAAPPVDAEPPVVLHLDALPDAPTALRRRVLRQAALAAGSPGGDLFAVHVAALDALVVSWHGQRGVDLPGRVTAVRRGSELRLGRAGAG
jgi:tRNA(Ile)-lysidine synthase